MRSSSRSLLLLIFLAGCVGPEPEGIAVDASAVAELDRGEDSAALEERRALTRAQFEASVHGATRHAGTGCPLCADPMRGKVPDDALIVGPADVWN